MDLYAANLFIAIAARVYSHHLICLGLICLGEWKEGGNDVLNGRAGPVKRPIMAVL